MSNPVRDLVEILAKALGEYIWRELQRLPLAISQSVQLTRIVTLAGFSLLSAGFIAFTIHLAKVQEAIRSTEEYTRDTSRNIELLFARTGTVADIAQDMLRRNPELDRHLDENRPVLPVQTLLRLSEADGLAVIVDGRVRYLHGALDRTAADRRWHDQRWAEIALKISRSLAERDEATVLLGSERRYRKKKELEGGLQFYGSVVVAKAWKDRALGWVAVVVLLPVSSFYPLLHLGAEEYLAGNYDYLVDCEGQILIHPRPFTVAGSGPDGRPVGSASNESEVGHLPINTRDSDWIAGGDMLSKAFNAMVRGKPGSIVYKNLQKENRLTSFRLVDLERQRIDGCLGIVAGRGLNTLEALTTPVLLQSPSAISNVLNLLVGAYLLSLGAWITFIMKIRSLHNDSLAWSRYASVSTAAGLGLLPIRKAPTAPHVYPDMVGIIITLNVSPLNKVKLGDLFNEFAGIAGILQEDGWLVSQWGMHSLFASRRVQEEGRDPDRPAHPWTPVNVVAYLKGLKGPESGTSVFGRSGAGAYRIAYGFGELRIHAFRTGAIQRAVISLFGNALIDVLHMEAELSDHPDESWGWLFYFPGDAVALGFEPAGAEFVLGGKTYRRLSLEP